MPAGAKTRTRLRHPGANDDGLPEWDKATVTRWGRTRATITDPAAIADLYFLRGPDMWQGYDHPDGAVGKATDSRTWFEVKFWRGGKQVAMIIFRRNEHGAFCWWFKSMKKDAKGDLHPRGGVFETWPNFVNEWLASVGAGV